MAGKMDWVPVPNYSLDFPIFPFVAPGTQFDFPLLDVLQFRSQDEVIGKVEDTPRYKVLRIIGYWTPMWAPTGNGTSGEVFVRIWPGFIDALDAAIVPGPISGGVAAGEASNEQFWWERIVPAVDINTGADKYERMEARSHPWNTFLDVKPNQWMGENEVPTLSIFNDTNSEIQFQHRWRMLVVTG